MAKLPSVHQRVGVLMETPSAEERRRLNRKALESAPAKRALGGVIAITGVGLGIWGLWATWQFLNDMRQPSPLYAQGAPAANAAAVHGFSAHKPPSL